ncbi:class I SAM-dependent methyltransferase [Cryptosporangium phraense]|uniref:Class I SAM-dependent methyltransferase n=1 Tax=Cryptosporangium phraense TaxID=2593070 RepID=A0A545ATI6_9ACTN|nr:class I SAM-dependent methyltransferase [Cryptosporangium phraense]TQS44648.1 class I SAM-dependent methyltransferase [Cryptosporangium phraense]
MAPRSPHTDRARAESFGGIATDYDRYRPVCPDALLADLVGLGPDRVLDVACGTGKIAVPLRAAGLDVLGVEIDERMAAVARGHGVPVEISPFESWDAAGRRFGLITCGNAWHWIDPERGPAKAAEVLESGGTIVRSWTYAVLDADARALLAAVYAEHAPDASTHAGSDEDDDEPLDPFASRPEFDAPEMRRYAWDLTIPGDEWVGLIATFSDHQLLPAGQRARLLEAVSGAIAAAGGVLRGHGRADALFTRRH